MTRRQGSRMVEMAGGFSGLSMEVMHVSSASSPLARTESHDPHLAAKESGE